MRNQEQSKLVKVNIDGEAFQVPHGTNIIEAAAQMGKEIPHYCYHPKLTVAGNCRMCLIEMGMPMRDRATGEPVLDEEGFQKIGWIPKPQIACATNVREGMHIRTKSPIVKDCQEGVMEMLLVNHPLDCPICDQAGECRLQEFAADYGRGYSRFVEQKNVKPKRITLGPRVTLDDERCILCSRCVRFCQEVVNDDVLGFIDHGSYSTLTCYPGKNLSNNYSLNTVDICPVGALTSTDFRFKMRVWFLKKANSICTESSVGVNTEVFSREGKIYRITPRRNDAVNDTWMPDSGRELYKQVETEDRLKRYLGNGNAISAEEAFLRVSETLPIGNTAYVGSSHMSVEEQYLLSKLVERKPGPVYWAYHVKEGDNLLISSDRTPNLRGALVTGVIDKIPPKDLTSLLTKIESGEIQNLIICREDITRLGIPVPAIKKMNVIYLGTHANDTSEAAKIVIPTLTVFEKTGSFVNQQFRLQKFHQAVPGPSGVLSDLLILNRIIELLGGKKEGMNLSDVWDSMSQNIPQFADMSFDDVPDEGLLLNCTAFNPLNFSEGETLHYKPKGADNNEHLALV